MFFISSANALESDKHQPIDIAADNAILDDKAGKAIYRGSVELTQGTLKIVADQLTIETGKEGKVEKVIAKGELAHFTQIPNENDKPIEAQANTVEYYVTKEKIVLIEQAKVVQNE
ncbi:MAG: lipopolysaccharide transport periplasmic protein LptA, partial [Pseudomonadales bacterium]|nr:lipopolysaccharide transport periplasmic protein LptA [Pseudomonadales bacterium]